MRLIVALTSYGRKVERTWSNALIHGTAIALGIGLTLYAGWDGGYDLPDYLLCVVIGASLGVMIATVIAVERGRAPRR